jgi:hypothetical protein
MPPPAGEVVYQWCQTGLHSIPESEPLIPLTETQEKTRSLQGKRIPHRTRPEITINYQKSSLILKIPSLGIKAKLEMPQKNNIAFVDTSPAYAS